MTDAPTNEPTAGPDLTDVSTPSRLAEPGEGITHDELGLAARNHALPLEALRYDVTPPGLHYLLIHYDIPAVDPDAWRLTVAGTGTTTYSLADLRALPSHTVRVTLECAGNGRAALEPRPLSQPWLSGAVGTADWTGVRLADLLADAGVPADTVDVVLTGLDHGIERGVEQDYQRGLPLDEALRDDVLVAHTMNGAPLPPQHGFPARLVVPGWYGMAHVTWLDRIETTPTTFDGYQMRAYRLRQDADDEGVPATRIEPRALLAPPGSPDFMTRTRILEAGTVALSGRAWSGWAPLTRVEVSTDDGRTWTDADLGAEPSDAHAWRSFTCRWEAAPGDHLLAVRAHDASGRVQAVEPVWTRGGFANNADQRVRVVVR